MAKRIKDYFSNLSFLDKVALSSLLITSIFIVIGILFVGGV